jgi:hypothetical protein
VTESGQLDKSLAQRRSEPNSQDGGGYTFTHGLMGWTVPWEKKSGSYRLGNCPFVPCNLPRYDWSKVNVGKCIYVSPDCNAVSHMQYVAQGLMRHRRSPSRHNTTTISEPMNTVYTYWEVLLCISCRKHSHSDQTRYIRISRCLMTFSAGDIIGNFQLTA